WMEAGKDSKLPVVLAAAAAQVVQCVKSLERESFGLPHCASPLPEFCPKAAAALPWESSAMSKGESVLESPSGGMTTGTCQVLPPSFENTKWLPTPNAA